MNAGAAGQTADILFMLEDYIQKSEDSLNMFGDPEDAIDKEVQELMQANLSVAIRLEETLRDQLTPKKEWRCAIPLEPIGKGRPRISMRGGFAKAYTPRKTAQWERGASLVLKANWRKPPLTVPVLVEFVSYRKRPKIMCTKAKLAVELCAVKPDVDNIAKCLLDSLVLGGILADDNLVVELKCSKRWAKPGQRGHIDLSVVIL